MSTTLQSKCRTVRTLALAVAMACTAWGTLAVEPIRIGSVLSVIGPVAIESTKGYVGPSGAVTMWPADHTGLDLASFRKLQVKGGDWAFAQ